MSSIPEKPPGVMTYYTLEWTCGRDRGCDTLMARSLAHAEAVLRVRHGAQVIPHGGRAATGAEVAALLESARSRTLDYRLSRQIGLNCPGGLPR